MSSAAFKDQKNYYSPDPGTGNSPASPLKFYFFESVGAPGRPNLVEKTNIFIL